MSRLDDAFRRELLQGSTEPRLVDAVQHGWAAGGKRMRSRLVYGLGEALGADRQQLDLAALSVELVHLASLLHDDVMDDADERRGRQATWKAHGVATTVLAGDWALSRAVSMVRPLHGDLDQHLLDTIEVMVSAQVTELASRQNLDDPLPRWKRVAYGKTASLVAWASAAPGWLTGHPQADALRAFGEAAGMAYQALDDLIDLIPSARPTKPAFTDLSTGTMALPICLAVENPDHLARIQAYWGTAGDPSELGEFLREHYLQDTLNWVVRYLDDAEHALAECPPAVQQVALSWTEMLRSRTLATAA